MGNLTDPIVISADYQKQDQFAFTRYPGLASLENLSSSCPALVILQRRTVGRIDGLHRRLPAVGLTERDVLRCV